MAQGILDNRQVAQKSQDIIDCIKSAYDSSECMVMYGNIMSEIFCPNLGLRQGGPLSPSLFNLILEKIVTDALESLQGTISIRGRTITNFAGDIDLLAR